MKNTGRTIPGWWLHIYPDNPNDNVDCKSFRSETKLKSAVALLEEQGIDYDVQEVEFTVYERYPIEGEQPPPPDKRPKCPQCAKTLRPRFWEVQDEEVRRWDGYQSYGHFCSLRCCERYANRVYDVEIRSMTD